MKYFALLFLSAALVSAADFRNGQAAWAVIGQPTFGAQKTDKPPKLVLGSAGGLAWVGGKLFVADSSRVGASTDPPAATRKTIASLFSIQRERAGSPTLDVAWRARGTHKTPGVPCAVSRRASS